MKNEVIATKCPAQPVARSAVSALAHTQNRYFVARGRLSMYMDACYLGLLAIDRDIATL